MTQVVLPYRPKAGEPEDVSQIMADFDAIVAVVNGGLKDDNFNASAAMDPGKIAPGANKKVLETVGGAAVWGDRGVPTGVIMPFLAAVGSIPSGWLLADGALVSRTTYADLFAVIGTTYNVGGEASDVFRLPNLKGRVPVGLDAAQTEFDTLGEPGGEKAHALSTPELASHSHTPQGGHLHGGVGGPPAAKFLVDMNVAEGVRGKLVNYNGPQDDPFAVWYMGSTGFAVVTQDAAAGGGQAHNNLQPYIALNYIVKT